VSSRHTGEREIDHPLRGIRRTLEWEKDASTEKKNRIEKSSSKKRNSSLGPHQHIKGVREGVDDFSSKKCRDCPEDGILLPQPRKSS